MLGHGHFGKVSLGRYQMEAVAVKRFPSSNVQSWRHETRMFELCMHHDAIVGFVASDSYCARGENEYWLVTTYHPHGSLHNFLRGRKREGGGEGEPRLLSTAELLRMASTTCSGLAHLHTHVRGYKGKPLMAHRDIKSANVLVKGDLTCCIADLGMVVVGGEEEGVGKGESSPVSSSSSVQGTRRYMSPEVLAATPLSNMSADCLAHFYTRSDVYSMGLVLWEMCRRTVTGEGEECVYVKSEGV